MITEKILEAIAEANDRLEAHALSVGINHEQPELPIAVTVDDANGCWVEYEDCTDELDALETISRFADRCAELELEQARPTVVGQFKTTVGQIDYFEGFDGQVYVFAEDLWDHARTHVQRFGVEGNPGYTVNHVGGTSPF